MTQTEALRLALEAMKVSNSAWKSLADSGDAGFWKAEKQGYYQLNEQAIKAVEAALEAKDEPVAWKWHQAPVKTSWGDGMVVSDLAIDKDHTASIYCERDQTAKVEAMFTPPQRTWVGLTDKEVNGFSEQYWDDDNMSMHSLIKAIEAKLKEKNT